MQNSAFSVLYSFI